jgi:hypothetical protein
MLCLFSHEPGSSSFKGLSLIQPPHQQTFVAATDLDESTIKMTYKKAYTVPVADPDGDPIAHKRWDRQPGAAAVPVYRWDTPGVEVRRLLMENLAKDYLDTVQADMPKTLFDDDTATSTLMASQLGSVCYKLIFSLPSGGVPIGSALSQVHQPRRSPSIPHLLPQIPSQIPSQPAYHYRVCPVDDPTSTKIPILPIEQDLLFLIDLEKYTEGSYELEEIRITIPFGKPGQGSSSLMETYAGSGAEMISNLRFNVMIDIETKNGQATAMVLRLVPRTRPKDDKPAHVPLRSCRELSFVLNGVLVNQFEAPTNVSWTVLEGYKYERPRAPFYKVNPIELVPPATEGGPYSCSKQ